ncbi:MAG TPA: hypothetical protein VMP68_32980 [Candidatus Eisenbacteria bacterium]|nr:hypothetical protein [Candidatus Eisenbacteria bacterium]
MAGQYSILVRYGSNPTEYCYIQGDPFTISDAGGQHSAARITLHFVAEGNYQAHRTTAALFDAVQPPEAPRAALTKERGVAHDVVFANELFRVAYEQFARHWGTMVVGEGGIRFESDRKNISLDFPFREVQEVGISNVWGKSFYGPGLLIRLKDGKRYNFATYNNYDSLIGAINRAIGQNR